MTSKSAAIPILLGYVFFSLATARNYRSFGRANTFRCPSEGFHADPNDCRIFYRCVDWNSNVFFRELSEPALTAFQFVCGKGTVFDPDFNICNRPRQSSRRECGGRATQDAINNQYPFAYSSTTGDSNPYQESNYPSNAYYEVSTFKPDRYPNEYENHISPETGPSESNSECTSEGFFPVPENCNMFMRCTDDGMGGFRKFTFRCGEGTVWDQRNQICNYPSAVPGCGGTNGNFPGDGQGYPGTGGNHNENNQYPEQGFPGQHGNEPGQSGFPQQGNYPGQGGYTDQTQNQGNGVSQSGYPQQGNQGSGSGAGTYPVQGHPGQGNGPPAPTYPGQTGYPDQNPGAYPGQQPSQIYNPGQYPQVGYPGQNGVVNEGNGPAPTSYPQQGNQGQANRPPSGEGYPSQQVNGPDQSSNTQPNGYPDSYPTQTGTGESGFPSEGYPEGGYPEAEVPNQSQAYPGQGPEEYGDGNPVPTGRPNECQTGGFFGVPGECTRFFRCVDNAMGGYFRYDFICGPGTVWDQKSITCNHPWAVQRTDCSTSTTADSSLSTSTQQQTTSNQSSSSLQTTSSFSNFTQSTSSSTPSSSSTSTQSQASSSSSSYQNQMTISSQQGQSQSTSNQQSNQQTSMQSQNGMTTPMKPGIKTTTMKPQQESTTASGDMSSPPPGSKPCQPVENTPIKCEKAGFYPVPGKCKKFYRCVDWDGNKGERFSVYYFECGDGTIWDPALETCNHEESVHPPRDCSGEPGKDNQLQPTTVKNTNATEWTTEGNSDATEPTTSEVDEFTQEESTNAKPTPTDESTGSTSQSTDMTTVPITTTPPATDLNEMTTPSTSESPPGQTPMVPENTNPTESTTETDTNQTSQKPGDSNERQNQTSAECPALGEGQVAFVCPTGFRRHPNDCNLFYQCTISKEGDVNVMTLSCRNETVYDERKIQCLPPEETDPCTTKSRTRTRVYRRIDPKPTSVVPIATSESLCPHEGHFPYQGDCRRFFKCQKDSQGKMQGYLYQCPERYSFSESSTSCEKSSTLPKCSRYHRYPAPLNLEWMSSKVPVESAR